MAANQKRGSIAFFATYRPPVQLDIYSSRVPATSNHDELCLTDESSYNYNCQAIPPAALKTILRSRKLGSEADVDSGRLSGYIFVSERENSLETLHIALCFNDDSSKPKVFNFAALYGTFNGVRMEDSGCIAGGYRVRNRTVDHSLIYVTTKDPSKYRRQPWNAVYKTNLRTGTTERLTPTETSDLSPSVSPTGNKIALASFEGKKGWNGEIEDLKTDIYVMNVENRLVRDKVIENGGWPTWGSDDIIFFHRKVSVEDPKKGYWAVFRADINKSEIVQITPPGIDAMTPAAISSTEVAVAIIRKKTMLYEFAKAREESEYRHIEIFDSTNKDHPVQITQKTRPRADHYNPFVIDGGKRIGYHRCKSELITDNAGVERKFHKMECPLPEVGLFRVSGVFPTFSKDGKRLAFVDNEFKAVWVADDRGLRIVYEGKGPDNIFSPVWNQNPEKDILYICMGPSFSAKSTLHICSIPNVSSGRRQRRQLTKIANNAFPFSNPDGTKVVFRSTRDFLGGGPKHKNLYIMEDAMIGEYGDGEIRRLTEGDWTDTHCQWSPNGDWIVFSSTRDKSKSIPYHEMDQGLDPGYFAVYLVNAKNENVVVRVFGSGDDLSGHVNHPFFSPDGRSIAVAADLAAVSVDPISLPLFLHSVRPYGDVFTVDIDPNDIERNRDVKRFRRITHSRYENATPSWTFFSTEDPNAAWNLAFTGSYAPACPYKYTEGGGDSWQMTGHLCIPKRCC